MGEPLTIQSRVNNDMADDTQPMGIAMIGYGFMGAVHSQAWRTVAHVFDVAPVRLSVLCGRDARGTVAAAEKLGWLEASTHWREVVGRPDVQIIDICTPGDSHAEIAIAALAAGKHVICEKPLANTVSEAEAMARAADQARSNNVRALVGFSYRRVPAIALARRFLLDGKLGEIRHVRATYLQDWIADSQFPLVWRLDKERSGSGALGDIGAHAIDLAEYLSGQSITEVSGTLETFVKHRPVAHSSAGLTAVGGGEQGEVTVDDAAFLCARMDGGAIATIEATRFATGRKNALRIEVNGSSGSVAFDFEAMNELHYYDASSPPCDAGFRRIIATEPDHPYLHAWWPPGHGLGYEHSFVHQSYDFLDDIAHDRDPSPSFSDGLRIQRVLSAVERSADDSSRWTYVADCR